MMPDQFDLAPVPRLPRHPSPPPSPSPCSGTVVAVLETVRTELERREFAYSRTRVDQRSAIRIGLREALDVLDRAIEAAEGVPT